MKYLKNNKEVIKIADDEKPKEKITFSEEIKCPHCKKMITIKKQKTLVTPAEPAEYNEKLIVEKAVQTKL